MDVHCFCLPCIIFSFLVREPLPPFPRLLSEGVLLPTTQVGRIKTEHVALSGLSKQLSKFIDTLVGFAGPGPEENIAEQSR